MKKLLQTLLFKDNKFLSARSAGWCERNHPALYEWVMVQFPEYEEFNQKAKAIYFGDYNRCAFCGGVMPYHNDRNKLYCSKTCSKQVTAKKLSEAWDDSRLVKMKATMIERYGVDNAGKLNIEQRVANTDYEARKQATIASNLKRYGVEWATQRQETKDKIVASNLKRYGTEHRLQNKEEMQKHLNTMVSRYGSPYAMQVQNLKERCFISALGKKFDVTGCTTYEEAKQAYLQSIGITAPFPYSIGYQAKLVSKDIAEKVVNGTLTRTDVANNFVDVHSAMKRYGLACGQVVNNEETEVVEYIQSLGFTVTRHNRTIIKPLELDIVVDGTNIAIEYNGVYWHDSFKSKQRHKEKTEMCERAGYQLIHIWSNDWKHKQEIIKSVLVSKLGVSTRLHARKCKLYLIPNSIAKVFYDTNHLKGYRQASYHIGLYYGGELVMCMSFSRHSKHQYELIRMASKLGVTVVGGMSKILAHFKENYNAKTLMSYVDRDISNGKAYLACGFKIVGYSDAYWYIAKNSGQIINRQTFQKRKLAMFVEFNPNLTEREILQATNKFHLIESSGNIKLIKEF